MLVAQNRTGPDSMLQTIFAQLAKNQPLTLISLGLGVSPGVMLDLYRQLAARRSQQQVEESNALTRD